MFLNLKTYRETESLSFRHRQIIEYSWLYIHESQLRTLGRKSFILIGPARESSRGNHLDARAFRKHE